MPEIAAIVPEEQPLVLSSLSPGTAQKRLALLVVLGILLVFILLTAGVISSSGTIQIPAFLPAYLTAMFVCDSITSILLFAQFSILRSRALLIIASAYLYTALILIPYVPGVSGRVVANWRNWWFAECRMAIRSVALRFPGVCHQLCIVKG